MLKHIHAGIKRAVHPALAIPEVVSLILEHLSSLLYNFPSSYADGCAHMTAFKRTSLVCKSWTRDSQRLLVRWIVSAKSILALERLYQLQGGTKGVNIGVRGISLRPTATRTTLTRDE